MENIKKAIIFDLDATLRSELAISTQGVTILRPNLDELIEKLKQAKNNGIDIIMCSHSSVESVERFLAMKPELRNIFDKLYTKDNSMNWGTFDRKQYPDEAIVYHDAHLPKPVTTFGYNSILFIDDGYVHRQSLERLYKQQNGITTKDVTFFSSYIYNVTEDDHNVSSLILGAEKGDTEAANMLREYLECERNEPGCSIMCKVIDDYMNKEFKPGLTIMDEKYRSEYDEKYGQRIFELKKIIKRYTRKQGYSDLFYDLTEGENKDNEFIKRIKEFYSTDKNYPYEGLQITRMTELQKREKELSDLEAEEKTISEAEELINIQNEKNGQNIGE